MNHDEKNSNPDMQPWIEPELEARVVAWVMGEASPFEIAELERLLGEKPELAIFKRRIEAVHGLVGEAARPDRAPLKMSAERRAKLLQTIGAPEAEPVASTPAVPVVLPMPGHRRKPRRVLPWIWAAAACLALGGVLAISFQKTYQRKSPVAMAQAEQQARHEVSRARAEADSLAQKSAPEFEKRAELAAFEVPADIEVAKAKNSGLDGLVARGATTPPIVSPPRRGGGGGGRGGFGGGQSGGRAADSGDNRIAAAVVYRGFGSAEPPPAASNAPAPEVRGFADAIAPALTAPASRERVAIAPPALPVPIISPARPAPASTALGFVSSTENFYGAGLEGRAAANAAGLDLSTTSADGFVFSSPTLSGAAGPQRQETAIGSGRAMAAEPPGIALNPFTVSADKDLGYVAANTISGARLNSSIGDLASSITVVTKEQLADFRAASPNDVLLYAADEKKRAESEAREPKADNPAPRPTEPAPKIEETSTAKEPVSTFSLHVSDVSFRLAQAALARGEVPEPARIRPEEFYNAFDYGDPAPTLAEKVGARIEQSAHPVLQQRNLVRVAFKVPASGRAASQPLRLTVLLDTSGSMEREDRLATVRQALAELVALLKPEDRITLIGFARQPRLLAEALPGNQAGSLVQMIARTPSQGGTNLEEALKLAGELARRHQLADAQNRIVLLTDGAANLGNANPAQLGTAVETLRQQGVAFDACGIGLNGLDDGILEALTRRGDGRYYVLDSPDAADAGFARQLAGAFRPAAENVKVQVRFNPARVSRYRLIGFDQHRLTEQDFRNDAVDAAELAAEEAAVALYEVEVLPQGSGEVGELFVRFRDPATGAMVERSWTIAHDPQARAFDRATPSLQLAGVSALLAEKLRQSPVAGQFRLGDLARSMNALRGAYSYEPRVQDLAIMFEQARRLGRD